MSSILGLELRSHNLPHLKAFYNGQLKFPVLTDLAEELALQIGETQLAFSHPDDHGARLFRLHGSRCVLDELL